MITVLLWILMQSAPAATQPALSDPYAVPKTERMEWYQRVATVGEGRDAAAAYAKAEAALVEAYDYAIRDEIGVATQDWLTLNDGELGRRLDWPTDHSEGIGKWLRKNDDALEALRSAADCPRHVFSQDSELKSMHDVASASNVRLFRYVRLLSAAAAEHGRESRWDAAYADWARLYRIAAHARQRPLAMDWLLGRAIEERSFELLCALLAAHPPANPTLLQKPLRDAWSLPAPEARTRIFVERLFESELVEREHAWARDPSGHSDVGEDIDLTFGIMSGSLQAGGPVPRFKDKESYRQALLASTPEKSLHAIRRRDAALDEWFALGTAAALRDRDRQLNRLAALADPDPLTRFHADNNLVSPVRMLMMEGRLQVLRRGSILLLAAYEWKSRHGEWPASLDVLKLPAETVDPYSGNPLIYRRSDDRATFVLYSVGGNQRDDGGIEPTNPTALLEDRDGDIVLWPRKAPAYTTPDGPP